MLASPNPATFSRLQVLEEYCTLGTVTLGKSSDSSPDLTSVPFLHRAICAVGMTPSTSAVISKVTTTLCWHRSRPASTQPQSKSLVLQHRNFQLLGRRPRSHATSYVHLVHYVPIHHKRFQHQTIIVTHTSTTASHLLPRLCSSNRHHIHVITVRQPLPRTSIPVLYLPPPWRLPRRIHIPSSFSFRSWFKVHSIQT